LKMSNNDNPAFCSRLLLHLLIIWALFFLSAHGATAADRTVRVGVYENAPKVFTSESGKPSGIFVDLIEYIAEKEGWRLSYVGGTWNQGLERLKNGEIDLMPDVAYTASREKTFSFHKVSVLSSWSQVYAPKGSKIQSILDLNGKRVAVLDNSIQQETFDRLTNSFGISIKLIPVPDYKTMFEMVPKGEADAAITNRFYGLMHAKKVGLEDTAVIFDPAELFFAAPKNDPKQLLPVIDHHLAGLKKDSRSLYYKSLKRWTSEELRLEFPTWLKALGLTLGAFLMVSLIESVVLRHKVNVRTRELQKINREMENRIAERTVDLAAATEKAQAADRIKSAFLATMSHELRTPLNSIIGFTGILLQGLAGPLNTEQHKQMGMVQTSARHLLSLINDVLDISKIEAGQLNLSWSPVDVRQSIEKTVRLVLPLAQQKGLELTLDIADNVDTAVTDQRRLEQVMLNVFNNAVKFTEKGDVHVACRRENGYYLLSVSDTGIGMKPEDMATLFQPFHQLDTGLSRKHEGTGLGLSICKKLMDMMGGAIEVESQPGQGSTFTVRFPKSSGEPI
jgi:signal transduction histidine kinase